MSENELDKPSALSRLFRWLFSWRTARRILITAACLITFIGLFYTEENWRGKRAWDRCKADLEARGYVMDWNAYIPPPIPDDQNIFKAPKMQEWFVGRAQNELSKRLNRGLFAAFAVSRTTNVLAELKVISPGQEVQPGEADLILNFADPALSAAQSSPLIIDTNLLPRITMTNVELQAAIQDLATRAGIRYRLQPGLSTGDVGGKLLLRASVGIDWQQITARQALLALLANYNLMLVQNPDDVEIRYQDPGTGVYRDPEAIRKITALVESFQDESARLTKSASLKSTQNWLLYDSPQLTTKIARIYVRADKIPSTAQMAQFFTGNTRTEENGLKIEPSTDHSFRVYAIPAHGYFAGDYLAWSDQFESEFNQIREALHRPYGRWEGDYQLSFAVPIPNFVTLRIVAQMLADRVKSHLLLHQREAAVRDLILVQDLNRMLEARPTGKPMTLVAAMIKVAITGLYADTVAEGFQHNAWGEPELIALQEQLESTDCLPQVSEAFIDLRAAEAHTFESLQRRRLINDFFAFDKDRPSLWQILKDPVYAAIAFAPRGWLYQNMVVFATVSQPIVETIELTNKVVLPAKALEFWKGVDRLNRRSPYNILATRALPNFVRATQALAQNQTKVNEAFLACALERYHLVHGQYPETLDALVPQFADKLPHDLIGGQPLHYQRKPDGKFLLYSIGWDETDDGGKVVLDSDGKQDREKADWVWQ